MKAVNIKLFLLVSIILMSLSACGTALVQPPKISIDNIELGELSLRKGEAVFSLNVHNPNRFPLYLYGVDYGLKLNGVSIAGGESRKTISISAGSQQKLRIPITLSTLTLLKMIPQFLGDRQLKYELHGSVKTPIISLPFHRIGGINVSEKDR
jgi:LEA14-like dessication related protein